jgi:hypothetical protein
VVPAKTSASEVTTTPTLVSTFFKDICLSKVSLEGERVGAKVSRPERLEKQIKVSDR